MQIRTEDTGGNSSAQAAHMNTIDWLRKSHIGPFEQMTCCSRHVAAYIVRTVLRFASGSARTSAAL